MQKLRNRPLRSSTTGSGSDAPPMSGPAAFGGERRSSSLGVPTGGGDGSKSVVGGGGGGGGGGGSIGGSRQSRPGTTVRRRKRRQHHQIKKASKWQILFGSLFSVLLLIFISVFDFQDETKKAKRKAAQVQKQRDSEHREKFGLGLPSSEKEILQRSLVPQGKCRYDGHCPVRSSCAAPLPAASDPTTTSAVVLGACEPIVPKGTTGSEAANEKCVDACLSELQKDEFFFQESGVDVDWTEDFSGGSGGNNRRPDGCLLVYTRRKQQTSGRRRLLSLFGQQQQDEPYEKGIPQDVLDWVDGRFRHVKRVDPLLDDDNAGTTEKKWVAYCTQPCSSDADCGTTATNSNGERAFRCNDGGACVRNPTYWDPPPQQQRDPPNTSSDGMVIVTGADVGYFQGLANMAASARYWAPSHKLVVYNLGGMDKVHLDEIRSWSNVLSVEWPDGIPNSYPKHVHVGKQYAWKPIIVNETVHAYGSIFWMDAGSTLAGPIDPIVQATHNTGIMLMKGQDLDMKPKSHEATYRWFGFDKRTMDVGPHFSGNTQAFLYPSRYIDSVVKKNAECALVERCIAPEGAKLTNHRYDQTSISILAYSPNVRLPHFTEFLAAEKSQLNPDLSKPSYKMVWTSRQSCHFYSRRDKETRGLDDRLKHVKLKHEATSLEKRLRGGEGARRQNAVARDGADDDGSDEDDPL